MNILKISGLTIIAFLTFNFSSFSQENNKSENDIKTDSLKQFLENFEQITLPFEFEEIYYKNEIDNNWINFFFKEIEDYGEKFYCSYIFYEKEYIGLIIIRNWCPGIAGVNNDFVFLFTISYNGKIIDNEELGCYCNDTNMGSNDYFATNLDVFIFENEINIYETNTHATLIIEEGQEHFENKNYKTYNYNLNSKGIIDYKKNNEN
ncbi:MAG: hypothetical protein JXR51_04835 [Bacteroidales bacterium]|nr:hypothetical protein [Bacteroidales bacterium]MBN2756484.1 hypothetical protein [Bacteroidales bacterium]